MVTSSAISTPIFFFVSACVRKLSRYGNSQRANRRVGADQTCVGKYITEGMKNAGIQNVEGIMFTEQRKEELATVLKEKMLKSEFKLPYDLALINDLNVERYELTKTGRIKFSHPEGSHDDRFWAFVLAVYGARSEAAPGPIIAKTFE